MRKGIWILVGFIVVMLLSLFWGWWQQVWYRPIKVVSVEDKLNYTEPMLVKDAVASEIEKGFFGMRIAKMRDQLLAVPWVQKASVCRKWPDTVLLHLQEREPLARYEKDGLIDTSGKLFFPALNSELQERLQSLPEFVGERKNLSTMIAMYLQILAKIKPLGLTLTKLVIRFDSGWHATLSNGLTIMLGKNELEDRLNRFVLAYNDNKSGLRGLNVGVVDLRYTNGMAVSDK